MTDKDFQKFVIEHLTRVSEGQEELQKNVVAMETELTEKIRALFDDRSVNQDYFKTINNTLARIENEQLFQSSLLIDTRKKQEAELRLLRAEK